MSEERCKWCGAYEMFPVTPVDGIEVFDCRTVTYPESNRWIRGAACYERQISALEKSLAEAKLVEQRSSDMELVRRRVLGYIR